MRIDSNKVKLIQGLMTQGELAEKAGISRQGLSTILSRGTCRPISLAKIASALDVEPKELFKEE